jgi:hypothetical protein
MNLDDYELNLLAYLAQKHTGDTFKTTIHSDYGTRLYNITRNGAYIGRGLTIEQARTLFLPLIPPALKNETPKSPRKNRK